MYYVQKVKETCIDHARDRLTALTGTVNAFLTLDRKFKLTSFVEIIIKLIYLDYENILSKLCVQFNENAFLLRFIVLSVKNLSTLKLKMNTFLRHENTMGNYAMITLEMCIIMCSVNEFDKLKKSCKAITLNFVQSQL